MKMPILKWKSLDEMMTIGDQVQQLFDKMFQETSFHSWEERFALTSSGGAAPKFDMRDTDENLVIEVAMPGLNKGDVKVSVSGNLLAIAGEVTREREFRGDDAYKYRRSHGSFYQVMELPAGVDAGNVKTSFSEGVLQIILPKAKPGIVSVPADTSLALPSEPVSDEIDEIS